MFDPTTFDPDDPEDVGGLLEHMHELAHRADHDMEDVLFVQLSCQETVLVVFALLNLSLVADCLSDDCARIVERLNELIPVQKPGWARGD